MPKFRLSYLTKLAQRRRGFLFRALLCWFIGLLSLSNDESVSYDKRFQLRGEQKVSAEIILIQIDAQDITKMNPLMKDLKNFSSLPRKDVFGASDSTYWDRQLWRTLLQKILEEDPKKVAVALFFDEQTSIQFTNPEEKKIFLDSRVIWSSNLSEYDKVYDSKFALPDHSNVGHYELRNDDDGLVRKIPQPRIDAPHLIEKLTGQSFPKKGSSAFINFRGSTNLFRSYNLSQVLDSSFPTKIFKNHIVIIGTKTGLDAKFQTPLGSMSRAEILAQMTDNVLSSRWIIRLSDWVYAILLLSLVIFAAFIITQYPHILALIIFIWIGTLCAALSAWFFDTFNFWFPALTPFVVLIVVWIIFVGHQASKIERQHFNLKQEQKALQELEQLKNNFVSLISHDLKTPLSKIEAISMRLLTTNQNSEITPDLKSLKDSSDELNRYIQSVLKVLRVESKDFRINIEPVDINELIETAIRQVKDLAQIKNISLTTNLEPLFLINLDMLLIKEVLVNLLDNAIKYTPPGGSIHVISQEVQDQIQVSIQDTGEGISEADLELVWHKFVRAKSQELKTKGSGLGLYLVKYFVELHGGNVKLESQLKHGTKVTFSIPLS